MRMPDIVGDTWLNSEPLGPEDLRGKVVLADFWTYSCINCLRTMPYLKRWWDKYREFDFLMIGIHAPEFAFEKEPENVGRAMRELWVEWPVVLDNRHVNWHNFANHYWPAKYMADRSGEIVYEHFGEGEYAQTEKMIQQLLLQDPRIQSLPTIDEEGAARSCVKPTPETYCGFLRGHLANNGGYARGAAATYERPVGLKDDSIALDGKFLAAPEYVESAEPGATLLLSFTATEVNLVLRAAADVAVISVSLDGEAVDAPIRGDDMDEGGTVTVGEPRMYNLLRSGSPLRATLAVTAAEGSFQAYAFTFSGCK